MTAHLLEAAQIVLLLFRAQPLDHLLALLERGHGLLQPVRRDWVGLRVLAKHVGVATQAAPARHDLLHRLDRRGELSELVGERVQTCGGGLRQSAAALAVLEGAASVLKAARERGRIVRRGRREPVPGHLQLGDAVGPRCAGKLLDLLDDSQATGVFPGELLGACPFRFPFLLALGHRLARRLEGGVDSRVSTPGPPRRRPEAPPRRSAHSRALQPPRRDRPRTRALRRQPGASAPAPGARRSSGCPRLAASPRPAIRDPGAWSGLAGGDLVPGPLRDGAEALGGSDSIQCGDRDIRVFGFQSHRENLFIVGQPGKCGEPGDRVAGMSGHRAERLRVTQALDGGQRVHRLACFRARRPRSPWSGLARSDGPRLRARRPGQQFPRRFPRVRVWPRPARPHRDRCAQRRPGGTRRPIG